MNPEPLSVLMPAKLSRPRLYYEDLSSEANAMGPFFFSYKCSVGGALGLLQRSQQVITDVLCFIFFILFFL